MIHRHRSGWIKFCVVIFAVSVLLPGCSSPENLPTEMFSPALETSISELTAVPRQTLDPTGDPAVPEPVQTLNATQTLTHSTEVEIVPLIEQSAARMITGTSGGVSQVLARFGEMNPQSADGPLAAAILLDAGEIQADVNPRSFWLLNPLKDTIRLERYLPHEDFLWMRYSRPARQVDLSKSLIQPGDLVYLIPADDRLFGSYYAVTRLDPDGRAYTVTILPGDESGTYRIDEALLYDPAELEDELLRNAPLALNGKRILVWHKRSYADQSEYEIQLNRILNRGGKWSVLVSEIGGETIFERDGSAILHPASIIKVPLGMLVLHSLTIDDQDLEEGLVKAPPQAGRTYEQLIHAMLVLSEETATDILEHDLVQRMGSSWIRSTLDDWGATQTTLEPRRSTAKEIERLFVGLYTDQILGKTTSRFMLDALGEVTGGDTVRLWKLQEVLPPGAVIYNKRGSLTNPMVVADAGILSMPNGNAYFFCLVGSPDDWTTFEELDQIIGDFALAWYQIQLVEGLGP